MDEYTRKFNTAEERDMQARHILSAVYDALKEKGYDPINQIVGYILTELNGRRLPQQAQAPGNRCSPACLTRHTMRCTDWNRGTPHRTR